ncbi:MAG: translation initiation factor IF-2 [Planctomycetaceae bacterium]|nr:translation initiation factor IF-2 [Planctomycetaceae bacterium]
MKIRIFALAKEMDMDSKVLIKHCNDAGVQVKASALASISPEERDIVIAYLNELSSQAAPAVVESHAPTRPAAPERTGKVRKMRAITPMTSRSNLPHAELSSTAASEPDQSGEGEPADELVEVESELVPSADVEAEVVATMEASPAEPESEVPQDGDEAPPTEDDESRVVPITREDYVPAGPGGMSGMREMGSRGSGTEGRTGTGKGTPRKPALPSVAAPPSIKLPSVRETKSEEAPAQKPVMKLTADLLKEQSPLQDHLRKHAEQKKQGKSSRQQKGDRSGISLIDQRRRRAERDKLERRPGGQGTRFRGSKRVPRRGRRGPIELKTSAQIELPISVRGLSEAIGRPAKEILRILFGQGQMITINEMIDEETAVEVGIELGVDIEIKRAETIEDALVASLEGEEPEGSLVARPPVITILGHVDHGKTSLLDRLRSASVAAGEAGGITQHIASYQVEHAGQKLTFVDTPGHAAFGEMRARGANVTDIIVLVVAADDGVMPQTIECISHAKASGAPIVVAMNKIDLPDVDETRVLQELTAQEILPAEWGGDVEVVRTSAETGQGIENLLETLILTDELHEHKANPDRSAVGVCLEAFRDEGRGVISWLIVQKGTLRVGDVVLCGGSFGRVRAIYDDYDREIGEAPPSTPVKITGLDSVPGAGEHFYVLDDIETAREAAEDRHHAGRMAALSVRGGGPRTMDDIINSAQAGKVQDLPLIIKGDTPGSLEAIRGELEKFEHPEVRIKILHEGVGGVNESDVYLASASRAVIVAFHVIAEDCAQSLADTEGVEVRRYNIIYELTDHICNVLEGMLEPERVEVATGRALVLQTFSTSRFGKIAGCRVLTGSIERNNRVHVIRDQTVLNDYEIASLKREKDDAKEVREGMECGIRLQGFNDVKEGDLLEAYRIDEVKRKLE